MSNKQTDHFIETAREAFQEIPKAEMDMFEVENIIRKLPEIELMHVYELVDDLLQRKFGKRLHY